MDGEILKRMQAPPFQNPFVLLQTIPGVGQLAAASILAETGPDLASFPSADQFASWAGLCPGNRESAGIQKGSQTTKGNSYLRTALVQCAWAATRKGGSVFQARFHHLASKGQKTAIVAVAHQMLIILYFMLKEGVPFRGAEAVPQQRRRQRRAHHHLRCLRRLGISVQIQDDANGLTQTG